MRKDWVNQRQKAEQIKQTYPSGTRIILLHMGDDPRPLPDNIRGTVKGVDDVGTVHCKFDNGRVLGLICGIDDFRKLSDEEREQENESVCL